MERMYLGLMEEEIPTLLLKNENLKGVKREGENVWFFYVNGNDDITVGVWDKRIKNTKSITRGNFTSFEALLWDVLGYDDFFAMFKDSLPYGL